MPNNAGTATPEQIDALLNFLDDHRDLARGRLRGAEGNAQAKRLWDELCNMLNSFGGCTKTVRQWQQVCFDRKHLAKKAAAHARRLASATGGGPSVAPPLSQWQLKVLSIMGDGFSGRQTTGVVQAFEINEPMPSTSSQNPSSSSQPQMGMAFDIPQANESAERHTQENVTHRIPSVPPARRRRGHSSDVRQRLFEIEEMRAQNDIVRNAELAEIRASLSQIQAALVELTQVIRDK